MNLDKIQKTLGNNLKSLEDPAKARRLKKALYVGLALAVISDFLVHRHHAVYFWDHIPGFSALYGLVSSVLIIIISKGIGHAFLMKKEDYYD